MIVLIIVIIVLLSGFCAFAVMAEDARKLKQIRTQISEIRPEGSKENKLAIKRQLIHLAGKIMDAAKRQEALHLIDTI